jgi:uncharacterized protein (TIGR03435 family)
MAIGTRMIWVSVIVGQIAAAQPFTVGQAAPKLAIGTFVQGRVEEKPEPKARLLEFWATWCPPCREAIPHLNELADQFKDRPIDFLSLTPENEETVRAFLKIHPIRGNVALDPEGKIFRLCGAGLPTTVLITSSGKIAAVTNEPDQITPALLEDLLSGRPINLPGISSLFRKPLAIGTQLNDSAASVRIAVTPALRESGWVATEDQFESGGAALSELLAFVYDISATRVIVPVRLQQQIYAVQAWAPPSHPDLLRPLMQDALAAAGGYRVKRETRLVDVLVVRGLPGKLHESRRNPPVSQAVPGHLTADGVELDLLRQHMENVIGKPVIVDQSGSSRVQYDLHWDVTKPGSFEAALRDQLGLELKPAQREIEVLVVEDRENSKP